ncbi:MAG TPA: hypothetical protein PKY82_31445, partial [Pyrinomonadaceae bacterium]|nr:hypothetical protein [Pyrinomonadaceae bacterium]
YLRILVRDDGHGINEKFLNVGRDGHWGLLGMRERAEKIGAQFKVWSRPDAGTEIELIVPSHIAFENKPSDQPFKWFSGKFARSSKNGENK